MNICKDLEPKSVFQFFEEICAIPHGSGKTKAISDYCVSFADKRGLTRFQDEKNNVIILKGGSEGYEDSEPVIIQGHMDMVCEKENGVEIDFEKDGLNLYVDGDFLRARGTTLGGDDGIALAYAFALLDDDTLEHPPLEVVFTVDEEIGMLGAEDIDVSMLRGRRLLNIDSDEEGIFLTSCAGGLTAECEMPVSYGTQAGYKFSLKVHKLLGGHSGMEIHKERGNGIVLMSRILKEISGQQEIYLESLAGGLKDNAIPREVTAAVLVKQEEAEGLKQAVARLNSTFKKEFKAADPEITVSLEEVGMAECRVLDMGSFAKTLFLLRNIPWGVQHMSMDIPGLVETSLNPGILKLGDDVLTLGFSVRSSVTTRKYDVTDKLSFLVEFLGGGITISGDYPAWEYNPDSPMRELMADTYRSLFGEEPRIQAIHAGLECGILSGKIEGLDCISFGPNNFDIHTPMERLSISSAQKVWKLIVEFMRRAK